MLWTIPGGSRAAVAAVALLLGAGAAAQPGDQPRWELGVAWGAASPALDSELTSSYVPTLSGHPEATGVAGQTIALEADDAGFLAATVDYRFGRSLGVRLLVGRHRPDLGGSSSEYAYTLRYASRQPPDYVPRPVEVSRSDPWPDPAGELEQWTLALELAARWDVGHGVALGASGGVAGYRLDGRLASLGYTAFHEGGHSVLFADTFVVSLEQEPTWAYGLAAGLETSVRLSARVVAVVEARVFWGPEQGVDLRVTSVESPEGFPAPPPAAEVEERLATPPLPVDPSFAAVAIGVRVTL